MAVVAQVRIEDVDDAVGGTAAASSSTASVYVRCKQQATAAPVAKSKSHPLPALQLDLIEGQSLWRCEITEAHKPMVLDCSAAEYLRALETAFTTGGSEKSSGGATREFVYKWSRKSGVLTLMEKSATDFAMKYTSIKFSRGDEKGAYWDALLQEIVETSAHAARETTRQRERIHALELLLKAKDDALETALHAKQQLENQLFEGFCAVLNAKKDEIQRLQHELVVAQMQAIHAESLAGAGASNGKQEKKKPRQPRPSVKAKGAKLKRKTKVVEDEEEEEEHQASSEDDDDEDAGDIHEESDSREDEDEECESEEEEESNRESRPVRRSRARRRAVDAYSQLPSAVRSSSQAYSADDVLSDLDAIMKQEVEANNDEIQSQDDDLSEKKRPRAVIAASARRAQAKKLKRETNASDEDEEEAQKKQQKKAPAAKSSPLRSAPPAPPSSVSPIDSDAEDILDMLA